MKRKKSKYKHVSINKKKYYFYKISWVDITSDGGHATAEEFDKFDDKFKPDESSFNAARQVFEAYATDKEFKEKVDAGKFAELNVHPSGDYFFKLPEDLRNKIPTYIKENINLERFIDA